MRGKPAKYLCGVEPQLCTGGSFIGSKAMATMASKGVRTHSSPEQAHACMQRSLVQQGYQKIDNCQFRPPDGGPVLVLTRPGKYGGMLRSGKEGGRHMPKYRSGGLVISR
jgi:CTP:molybdopterin cytidylyltransferase MocA